MKKIYPLVDNSGVLQRATFVPCWFSTYISNLHASSPSQLFDCADAISQFVSGTEDFLNFSNKSSLIPDFSLPYINLAKCVERSFTFPRSACQVNHSFINNESPYRIDSVRYFEIITDKSPR